ncbi:MAG TPA: uracil-DNA glycosylase [Chthonomonadaceae bacterium]|nr:uracil-DNA glycosylase [Chthonomonadaceae bacterium]
MINDRPVGSSEEAGRALQAAAVAEQSVLAANGAPPAERLAALAAHASRCTACGLAATRNTVVFGEGNPEAPLMLIGEGPGQNEDATGRPFVGRSGALLDECLRENGILRKHVFVCNVIRCRACMLDAGRLRNRPPTPEEAAACSTWLEQTIHIVQPYVILCLGAPSANAIIRRGFRLMQERGQWFETRFTRYASATLHPAYILRLEGDAYQSARETLVSDIGAARRKVIEAKREPRMTLF